MIDLSYDAWSSVQPLWHEGGQGHRPDDQLDFHVDLGCGTLKKARIGVDRYPAPGVNVVADLETLTADAVAPEPGADAVDLSTGRYFTGGFREAAYYELGAGDEAPCVCFGLPFEDSSVESMISHHALEHIGEGFIGLMDECYRILKPGAPFRIIVPLFPSTAAVEDPDHKRYFMENTFDSFCGTPGGIWCEEFSVPYTKARFELTDKDFTALLAPELRWGPQDRRELRLTLRAVK